MTFGPSIRRRRRGSHGILRWILAGIAAVVLFAAGVAVGQALEEQPRGARPVTSFATIQPWTQTNRLTVTQTVTEP